MYQLAARKHTVRSIGLLVVFLAEEQLDRVFAGNALTCRAVFVRHPACFTLRYLKTSFPRTVAGRPLGRMIIVRTAAAFAFRRKRRARTTFLEEIYAALYAGLAFTTELTVDRFPFVRRVAAFARIPVLVPHAVLTRIAVDVRIRRRLAVVFRIRVQSALTQTRRVIQRLDCRSRTRVYLRTGRTARVAELKLRLY